MERDRDVQCCISHLFFHAYMAALLAYKYKTGPGKYLNCFVPGNYRERALNRNLDDPCSFHGYNFVVGFKVKGDCLFDIVLCLLESPPLRNATGKGGHSDNIPAILSFGHHNFEMHRFPLLAIISFRTNNG
jgi:hypothetical protein